MKTAIQHRFSGLIAKRKQVRAILIFTILTMFLLGSSLNQVSAADFSISGQITTIIGQTNNPFQVQKDAFVVQVSGSSWQITLTPIEWKSQVTNSADIPPISIKAFSDGDRFYHEVLPAKSVAKTFQQLTFGAYPYPTGIPGSAIYVLWYAFASGDFLEKQKADLLPPARSFVGIVPDNVPGHSLLVQGRYLRHRSEPFLPESVTLSLFDKEFPDQVKDRFLTNTFLASYEFVKLHSVSLPTRIECTYNAFPSFNPVKTFVSGKVFATVDPTSFSTNPGEILSSPSISDPSLITDLRPLQKGTGPGVSYFSGKEFP